MSSLRWYRAVKDTFGVEEYVVSWIGHEAVWFKVSVENWFCGVV